LQDLDTLADQIVVRRRALPEHRAVETIEARRSALRVAVAARAATRQSQLAEQQQLEDELATAEARAAELASRLKTIFVPREAEAVMAEQRTLAGRRSGLEDAILERMGAVAELDDLDAADRKVDDEHASELVTARATLSVAEEALDAELADVAARRAVIVGTLPESLLTRYDRLRRSFDGVAIARLEGGRCLGCHLALSTSELDRIRHEPADALVECEHCGRLLVR
jgi:predicted  nucleic acid-binding Zn-ribbon protein